MDLRFTGKKFGEDAREPQRFVAEFFPHPLIAGGRCISFVEDQVDHREYGLKPAAQLVSARDFEGNMGFGESSLGAKDSLAHGLLRDKEGSGDFSGREAAN